MRERCVFVPVDEEVTVEAAKIRHKERFSLRNSIILATARRFNAKVVTGDKAFKELKDAFYLGK